MELDQMYLSAQDPGFSARTLRQGDIVSDMLLAGAINLNQVSYSNDLRGKQLAWNVNTPAEAGWAIVLSHSCELDIDNNGIKVTSIILAPLRDIDKATSPGRVEELKNTNIIREGTTASYMKYFYLPEHSMLPFKAGAVADFSKIFSFRKQSYDYIKDRKKLQLQAEAVMALSLKLALYFHRKQSA